MSKHKPVDKHPDGQGNRGGGGVCGACGGARGRWERTEQIVKGKRERIDSWKNCTRCGGSGRSR